MEAPAREFLWSCFVLFVFLAFILFTLFFFTLKHKINSVSVRVNVIDSGW